jgi:hypothetical protein
VSRNTILRDMAKYANGEKCPLRDTRVRYIAPAYNEYQVYAAFFVEGAECAAYWPMQEGTA